MYNKNEEYNKYITYILNNVKLVAKLVNEELIKRNDELVDLVIGTVNNAFENPVHYKWIDNGCPYDDSGDIVKDGIIDVNQTIFDFFSNEYTGDRTATYESGHGFSFNTYGTELEDDSHRWSTGIQCDIMKDFIKGKYPEFNENIFSEIFDDIFDPIYDECDSPYFFSYEEAVERSGLGEKKIYEVLKLETIAKLALSSDERVLNEKQKVLA